MILRDSYLKYHSERLKQLKYEVDGLIIESLWMDGWMDLLVGTGVATALAIVQWPKPFLEPAKPLRSGWLFQRINSSTATTYPERPYSIYSISIVEVDKLQRDLG